MIIALFNKFTNPIRKEVIDMVTVLENRVQFFKDQLLSQRIDYALLVSPYSIYYFTGFLSNPHERFMGLLFDQQKGSVSLYVPLLDEEAAREQALGVRVIPISDEENPMTILGQLIPDPCGVLGIEANTLTYGRFKALSEAFSPVEIVDITPVVNEQRLYKSKEEIGVIKEAIRIIELVMDEGIRKVKPGMTEAELTAELEYLMRMHGADGPSFSTIVLSGEKAALPHGSPGARKITAGDFLLIDMGVVKDGYCSDITRTFVIGEPTEEQQRIYNIVRRSNEAGIEASRAGVPLCGIDSASRKVIEDEGYGKFFNNRVGHGVGIEVHEAPSVHAKNEIPAETGNVFTIEPGIYIPGYGGVRIEDIVHLTEDGHAEVLTSFPKDLRIIGH